MAKTLADGGFPEEAPALLAKSLRAMATALLATRAEAPVHGQGRRRQRHSPLGRLRGVAARSRGLLEETQSLSSAAVIEDVAPALAGAARILATIMRTEPRLATQTQTA